MSAWIKLIPKGSPNDDGSWKQVPDRDYRGQWVGLVSHYADQIPETHFMCAFSLNPPEPGASLFTDTTVGSPT